MSSAGVCARAMPPPWHCRNDGNSQWFEFEAGPLHRIILGIDGKED